MSVVFRVRVCVCVEVEVEVVGGWWCGVCVW
jgi:hypothetical protein